LLKIFRTEEVVICVDGEGREIRAALEILEPELEDAGTTTGGMGLWVCLYETPRHHLTELVVKAPETGDDEALFAAFEKIREWYERNLARSLEPDPPMPAEEERASWLRDLLGLKEAAAGTATTGAWDAIHIWEWSSPFSGDYRGSTDSVGNYRFAMTVYNLASDDLGSDWYRLDFETLVEIDNYVMNGNKFGDTSGNCGWWLEQARASISVLTTGGEWYEYMPDTTVGSTTTGFTIGGSLTTSQAGVSGGYSQSYGTSDVTIEVKADPVNNTIDWTSSLRGCDNYAYYPDYRGASSAAKTTYDLNPSLIVRVPQGSTMRFATSANNDWSFTARKDRIECGFACLSINSTAYRTTHSHVATHTCTSTGCS
jgi:hypothetical protein